MYLSKAFFLTYQDSDWEPGSWMLTILTSNTLTEACFFCNYCTNGNNIIMEDEEHVIFCCPEYDTCRQWFFQEYIPIWNKKSYARKKPGIYVKLLLNWGLLLFPVRNEKISVPMIGIPVQKSWWGHRTGRLGHWTDDEGPARQGTGWGTGWDC